MPRTSALRSRGETAASSRSDGGDGYFNGCKPRLQQRRFPLVGAGDAVFSFIHVADAAAIETLTAELEAAARANQKVQNALGDQTVRKVVVVPKNLVNLVAG